MRNLPEILQGVPRWAFLLAVPGAAFVLATIVAFALSSDGGSNTPPPEAPERLTVQNLDVAPTATVQPTPSPANRKDCNAITGTAYQSDDERDWYRTNCSNTAAAGTGGGGGGGGAAAATGGGGGGHVTGSEYGIGARLVIPSIGLNATVTGMDVGASGQMPDPNGYFNAVLYNFPSHPGMGGKNKVLAGHVDCAHCHNGGSGTAVFWSVRSLTAGATAQYVNPDGSITNYTVVASYAVSPQTDWGGIVASSAADMTLITCTGVFSGGEYNNRHVVQLKIT
ncbi:MAG TPA: class F sortase [Dehalococcoidia bacterium]